MNNKCQINLVFVSVAIFVLISICTLLNINMCFAEDASSNSSNYEVTGQLDFSGQTSTSANYSVSGIMTDIKDVSVWPEEEEIMPTPTLTPTQPPAEIPPWQNIIDWLKSFLDSDLMHLLQWLLPLIAGLITGLNAIIPWLLNLPWLSLGSNFWSGFLAFFGWYRKRKKWGIVYDAESSQPIAMATVKIFSFEDKKLLETQLTANDGRFGFLLKPGKYYLQAVKENYTFPSEITYHDYHGQEIEIKEEALLNLNIPMDPDIQKLSSRLNIITKIGNFTQKVRIPVLIIGTLIAILFFLVYTNWVNTAIMLLYIILWSIEIYRWSKDKSFGTVASIDDKTPIHLAILRVLNKENGKLVATRVTGPKGYYYYIINPGEYTLVVTKENYDQYKIADLPIKKGEILSRDIFMQKIQS